ncbi:MAG TPA: hypothetical protein DD640_06470, partial [Clostridiales bacterium]|nr:hypothetical protein [Clostridiales bacterium]
EGRILRDKGLYILPVAKSSEVIVLNLTAWEEFAAANPRFADPAATLATWESVGLAAESYRNWSGQAMIGLDSLANYLIAGCKQLGVDLLQVTNGQGQINFDREALHRLWDIYYVNTVQGGFAAYGDYRTDDLASGQLIAGAVSSASGSWLPEQAWLNGKQRDVTWLALPYPVFRDAQAVCIQQGAGMAVTRSNSKQEAAAVIFLSWLTRPEQNVTFAISAGYLPVTQSGLHSQLLQDSMLDLGQSGTYLCLNAFLNQLSVSQLHFAPAFAESQDIRALLENSLAKFAAEARKTWENQAANGTCTEKLQTLLCTEAAFEKWYSQLVLDAGQMLDQN